MKAIEQLQDLAAACRNESVRASEAVSTAVMLRKLFEATHGVLSQVDGVSSEAHLPCYVDGELEHLSYFLGSTELSVAEKLEAIVDDLAAVLDDAKSLANYAAGLIPILEEQFGGLGPEDERARDAASRIQLTLAE